MPVEEVPKVDRGELGIEAERRVPVGVLIERLLRLVTKLPVAGRDTGRNRSLIPRVHRAVAIHVHAGHRHGRSRVRRRRAGRHILRYRRRHRQNPVAHAALVTRVDHVIAVDIRALPGRDVFGVRGRTRVHGFRTAVEPGVCRCACHRSATARIAATTAAARHRIGSLRPLSENAHVPAIVPPVSDLVNHCFCGCVTGDGFSGTCGPGTRAGSGNGRQHDWMLRLRAECQPNAVVTKSQTTARA